MTGLASGSGLVSELAGGADGDGGACAGGGLEATTDPFDRAHRQFGTGTGAELLVSGRVAVFARPRQYHSSYMVGRLGSRVSFETMVERTAERAARLGLDRGPTMAQAVVGRLASMDDHAARTVVRGAELKERYGESASERAEAASMAEHELKVRAILGGGA
ncbi:MAG: hypothetical protein ACIAQU_02315 [Phycisphaerales bacterium JB064]